MGTGASTTTSTGSTATVTPGASGGTTTGTATSSSIPASNGAATAILPAQLVVNADGSVTPPTIEGPAGTAVLLTVTSHANHQVEVEAASRSLAVAPGGHASVRVAGLRAGRYPVSVDRRPRAALVIGAQPGP
jgi:hypothetical protein